MDIDNTSPEAPTPSTRIAELNQIDHKISTLLTSASTATSILSNQQPTSLPTAQSAFTTAANTYFSTLSAIEVRLRRQVYALEEAGLIQAGDERDARRGRTLNNEDVSMLRRGPGGALDPSWLNARASEASQVEMKREVLEKAKRLVEDGDVDMKDSDGNG